MTEKGFPMICAITTKHSAPKCSGLLPVVLLLLAPIPVSGQMEVNGIALDVEFQTGAYLVAQPLWIRCSLTNRTPKNLVVPYDRYGTASTFLFNIVGPGGVRLPRLEHEEATIGPRALVIRAGKRFVETFNLYDECAIAEPGVYQVSVTFESDGKYYEIDKSIGGPVERAGWKGSLTAEVGTIQIVKPAEPTDIAALEAITPSADQVPRQGEHRFPYLSVFSETNRKILNDQHPRSRYTPYAHYFQALADLKRFERSTSPTFAKSAVEHLTVIETTDFGPLFAEQVLYQLIRARRAAGHAPEDIGKAIKEFARAYPASPYLDELKAPGVSGTKP